MPDTGAVAIGSAVTYSVLAQSRTVVAFQYIDWSSVEDGVNLSLYGPGSRSIEYRPCASVETPSAGPGVHVPPDSTSHVTFAETPSGWLPSARKPRFPKRSRRGRCSGSGDSACVTSTVREHCNDEGADTAAGERGM